ncbi:formate dehydrogenase [Nocardioides euryhalodurans]|uniref:Formate dehydrogenase n=2 Tax=Nocardioides euryhalodurans TaxID=2518370 RepID=A0A4P7GQ65_9ACTN|nr:formate dehydrogenase [Nocardioides euryhalodurans]
MPVLRDLMEEFGHISRDDVATVADVLNLSVAEVHGVVSFYHDFRTTPPPAHTIALCRAEACQSVGGEQVFAETVAAHEGRDDVEVREVFCLGNCALGPSGMLDGRLHGRLDADRIAALTGDWR